MEHAKKIKKLWHFSKKFEKGINNESIRVSKQA
jgi:hypothetical protein